MLLAAAGNRGSRRQSPFARVAAAAERGLVAVFLIAGHAAGGPEGSEEDRSEDWDVDCDDSGKGFPHSPAVDVQCAWAGLQRHDHADQCRCDDEHAGE